MSRTLPFFESAWASARASALAGQRSEALSRLQPLLLGKDAPTRLQFLGHRLAARIQHAAHNIPKTRLHLLRALRLNPDDAETLFELGRLVETCYATKVHLSIRYYRRAAKLHPQTAHYHVAYGRMLTRAGEAQRGCRRLLRGWKLSKDRAIFVDVVRGLIEAGRYRRAHRLLDDARFLPHTLGDISPLRLELSNARAAAKKARLSAVIPFPVAAGEMGVSRGVRSDVGAAKVFRPHFGPSAHRHRG
jgi:predicted Zn-dependent protease